MLKGNIKIIKQYRYTYIVYMYILTVDISIYVWDDIKVAAGLFFPKQKRIALREDDRNYGCVCVPWVASGKLTHLEMSRVQSCPVGKQPWISRDSYARRVLPTL